jgi:hypothetical protein
MRLYSSLFKTLRVLFRTMGFTQNPTKGAAVARRKRTSDRNYKDSDRTRAKNQHPHSAGQNCNLPGWSSGQFLQSFSFTSLLVTFLFIVLPASYYIYLTNISTYQPESLSGLDILNDCGRKISGAVTMQPDFKSANIHVGVSIANAEHILQQCKIIKFDFPGRTINHKYLLSAREPGDTGFDPSVGIVSPRKQLWDVQRLPFGFDEITVDLAKTPDFEGTIEFDWIQGLWKKSYAEYELNLPFYATMSEKDSLRNAEDFKISMVVNQKYHLKTSSLEPSSLKPLGPLLFTWFDIAPSKSVLDIVFEDESQAKWKDRLQNLCIALFGLGLAVFVGIVTRRIRSSIVR